MKSMPAGRVLAFGLAAIAIAHAPAHAARPVRPPLTELTQPYNFVLVAKAESREGENRIVFRRLEKLFAEGEPLVSVRMDEETCTDVALGGTYIVAYTTVTNDAQFREHKYLDPEGPKLLDVRGFGAPALFEPTRELRFLFQTARAEEQPTDRAVLDALLAQMARPDSRSRSLVILELYLRPELQALVSESDEKIIRDAIADRGLHAELKSFLLEAALKFPRPDKATWLAAAYRDVIATSGVQFDLTTHVPELVDTAVKGLRVVGERSDAQRLAPLLLSNAPGVATAALETMDVLDPEGTPVAVRKVLEDSLWDDSVNPEVRRVLESYNFEHTAARAGAAQQ
jgi:hypothetical protein